MLQTEKSRDANRGDSHLKFDPDKQRAAREAITKIDAFPELLTRLTRVFGPGPERDIVHQLIYWFGKPKMQHRWWAYKTAKEWRDERGLNRKQVNKGRARLKSYGVLEEKYGNYKRLHYRLDWVKLAELLSLSLEGGQSYEWDELEDDDFFDEPLEPFKGGQSSWSDTPKGESIVIDTPSTGDTPHTYAEKPSNGGSQIKAGDNAGTYLQDNSVLHTGANPASAEPAPQKMNGTEPQPDVHGAQPNGDKRNSQDGDARSEMTVAWRELELKEDAKDRRFLRAVLEDPPTPELAETLECYRRGQLAIAALTNRMRGKVYLRGCAAYDSLRPEQVGVVLEELGIEQGE